jgi:hypothetical protein
VDIVTSGTVRPAFGWFAPPTPYARVKVGAVTLDTASFMLAPMNAR